VSLTYFNGGTILRAEFNGNDLKRIYFNGGIVFERLVVPVINSITAVPSSIDDDVTTQLNIDATDPLGGTLSYNWTSADGGSFSDTGISNPVFTPPAVIGTKVFTITGWVTNEDTTDIAQVDVTVTQASHTHCSVTNPSSSYAHAPVSNITVGLQVLDVTYHGHQLARAIQFYGRDDGTGSGGYASSYVYINPESNSFTGSSTVQINGATYGIGTSGGNIYVISGGNSSAANISITGCSVSGGSVSVSDAVGNWIGFHAQNGNEFGLSIDTPNDPDIATKAFTLYNIEYPGPE